MNVLIATSSYGDDAIQLLEDSGFKVINNPYKRKITQSELSMLLQGVVGVIAGLEMYDYDILSNSELKVISRCGSGMSNAEKLRQVNKAVASKDPGDASSRLAASAQESESEESKNRRREMDEDVYN